MFEYIELEFMSTDLDDISLGQRQVASTPYPKKRRFKNATTLRSAFLCISFGVTIVFLILAFRLRAEHKLYAQRVRAGIQNIYLDIGSRSLGPSLQRSASSWNSDLFLVTRPTVHEAFQGKLTFVSNQTASDGLEARRARGFKTVVEPNTNINQYGLTVFKDVCARPDGAIVTVGISDKELSAEISKVQDLLLDWSSTYNCSLGPDYGCVGYEPIGAEGFPSNALWISGTTTQIVPSKGNVFHNFGDRLWPHLVGSLYPLNETIPHPFDHFLVNRIGTWLQQAVDNMERNTCLYQIKLLGDVAAPKADFLVMDGLDKTKDLVCYEQLVLACTACGRLSHKLGEDLSTAAILRYRRNGLQRLGIPEPVTPLPPRRLRVAIYGRWDTRRRRVANVQEVAHHLQRYQNPPFVVTLVDELLLSHRYNQSLPEAVSLMTQTDILITVHGANTWATIFLPVHAAVVEIEGPCGPTTWMSTIAKALGLKHDTSNPWGRRVASPVAGNTTECMDAVQTPDMTVDLGKLDEIISGLASSTSGADDRISQHWNYDWQRPHLSASSP